MLLASGFFSACFEELVNASDIKVTSCPGTRKKDTSGFATFKPVFGHSWLGEIVVTGKELIQLFDDNSIKQVHAGISGITKKIGIISVLI